MSMCECASMNSCERNLQQETLQLFSLVVSLFCQKIHILTEIVIKVETVIIRRHLKIKEEIHTKLLTNNVLLVRFV